MSKELLKKIFGILAIVFVVLLTIKFIKVLPAIVKVLALAANVFTIWWAYTELIKNRNKNQNKEDEESN